MHATTGYDDAAWQMFETFNLAVGFGQPAPYATYAALRSEAGVHAGLPHLGMPGNADGVPPVFSVYSYDAAVQILRDTETFSSLAYHEMIGKVMGRSLIEMDPPLHREYRSLLQPSLGPKTMDSWRSRYVTPLLAEMTAELRPQGRADLVRGFLFAFPMRTFAAILGLPTAQYSDFHYTAIELVTLSYDLDKGLASANKLGDMFASVLTDRRERPADDLISVLAHAEHNGQRLTDEEIYSFLRLLLPAGAETTYRSSSSLLVGLLSDQDQLDAVREDPAAMTAAINEAVRWETPLQFVPRLTTRDTEIDGVSIPAGATVMVVIGAANHDPTRWDDPERFDLRRPYKSALAFGHGVHLCIGMHLSKMETEDLVRALLDSLPGLRLDPDYPPPTIEGTLMRSPAQLNVVWDA
ncbi:cytochrome P450 [Mycolicibacterium sp. BK556]|uniref:cytochrome P450 n=1 Tax=unclassified Mycolicibacterium TaxID=2636767 RepID=UPI00161888FF|nr:cytochrome P450 [Mycolicibacterium sp. BK556]MBB3633976.1 cytochrome P450 [Mycolicibacterium sp. BK607]MBB3751558.1 cytochrome P450 [Mycolicibacterium sp. BK634]